MGLYQNVLETADGGAFVNLRDSVGNGITSTTISAKQALDVNVANSISVGVADETAFTYGTSTFLPIGGVFSSSVTPLTSGQSGAASLTATRAVWSNLRTSTGTELGNSAANAIFNQDQTAFSATGTQTSPSITTSSSTALASNLLRKGVSFYNPTLFTVYITAGSTSATTTFTFAIRPNSFYEPSGRFIYTGIYSMISTAGASGSLQVTEYT